MREQFDVELAELRQNLIKIYAKIDLELHEAVGSLIQSDGARAKRVRKAIHKVEHLAMELEERAYNLIVLQNPVASDLRLLQFIIYVSFNLQRMANHVRNIAKTTSRAAGHDVPGHLLDLLASLAHLVYRVLGSTVEAIVENDLVAATALPELDEPVDELYRQFFKTFSKLKTQDDIDAAGRVMMAARMLERISDNSVEVGDRLVFLLTGQRRSLDDLSELDSDEIEEMQVAQGLGFTMGQQKLVEAANVIPEVDFGEKNNTGSNADLRAQNNAEASAGSSSKEISFEKSVQSGSGAQHGE